MALWEWIILLGGVILLLCALIYFFLKSPASKKKPVPEKTGRPRVSWQHFIGTHGS